MGRRPVLEREPAFRMADGRNRLPEDGRYLNAVELTERGAPNPVIRAYWREDTTVYARSFSVPPCFFLRRGDLDSMPPVKRALARAPYVRRIATEGSYYRVTMRDAFVHRKLVSKVAEDKKGFAPAKDGYLWEKGLEPLEADVRPVRRWSVDNAVKVQRGRRCYLDIETDSRVPMQEKETSRLLCWAVVDDEGNRFTGLLNENDDIDERRLLEELFAALMPFDQVCAWSGDWFDFPVIRARAEDAGMRVDFGRWTWLDHLELYKRMIQSAAYMTGEGKQSMALEAVAKFELGAGKTKGESGEALGSRTWELWNSGNRELLVQYCADDADLLRRIEKKTGYIELSQTICESTGVFANTDGIRPSAYVESFMMHLGRERDHRFPTCYWNAKKEESHEKYRGAFVLEPRRGIMRDVHVCDFAGLYPSIIMTWNMSPETLRTPEVSTSLFQPLYLSHLEPKNTETKIPDGCALAAITDQVFAQSPKGILAVACEELGRLRKHWTKLKDKAVPNSPEYFDADRRATSYKVARNSFYGIVGAPSSRFFKREVAESVAQQSVWLFGEVAKVLRSKNIELVYGDTDGLYGAGCTRAEFAAAVKEFNTEVLPSLLRARGCAENYISLEHEKGYDRVIFTSKKRYIGSWSYYKGVAAKADNPPEIKGFEYKRGDALKLERELQEETIYSLLGYKRPIQETPEEFRSLASRYRDLVKSGSLDAEDILCSVKLSHSIGANVSTRPRKKQPRNLKECLGDWARFFLREDKSRVRRASVEGVIVRIERENIVIRAITGEEKTIGLGQFEMVVHEAEEPHDYVARMLHSRGRDTSKGAKIAYFWTKAGPRPVEDFDIALVDRDKVWGDIWPATQRLLEAAFPSESWAEFKYLTGMNAPAPVAGARRASAPKSKAPSNQLSLFDLAVNSSVNVT